MIKKKLLKYFCIFATVSLLFCLLSKPKDFSAFFVLFIGFLGTFASCFSIFISEKDQIRAQKENEEQKRYLKELQSTVDNILESVSILRAQKFNPESKNPSISSNISESDTNSDNSPPKPEPISDTWQDNPKDEKETH